MTSSSDIANPDDLGGDGFADSDSVKIHYVTKGAGPLVVLIHGFPDFWYMWHGQIPALARHFQVVAIDLRGFNLSDQPRGVEHYTMDKLVGDVGAVVKHFNKDRAILVGHDAGGWISWRYAMAHPDQTDRLVILNLPHPACLERELVNNPQQYKASAYARQIQQDGRGLQEDGSTIEVTPERFVHWVKTGAIHPFLDDAGRKKYVEAYERTSFEGMLNFYKVNYPRPPYQEETYPPVRCPVLMFHGLDDPWLMPGTLNDTWRCVEKELTLVTVPNAGHWVHYDAADLVTKRMLSWLTQG
jgi:pimeloyl-ACP methyl ester carboxylesterase